MLRETTEWEGWSFQNSFTLFLKGHNMAHSKEHKFLLRPKALKIPNLCSLNPPFLLGCVLASAEHKPFSVRFISQKEKKACVRKLMFWGSWTNTFWCRVLKHQHKRLLTPATGSASLRACGTAQPRVKQLPGFAVPSSMQPRISTSSICQATSCTGSGSASCVIPQPLGMNHAEN